MFKVYLLYVSVCFAGMGFLKVGFFYYFERAGMIQNLFPMCLGNFN